MDPDLVKMLREQTAVGANAFTQDIQLGYRRMANGAEFDHRTLNGALAGSILRGDNASEIAGLNAAIRAPTTIDHPNAVVGK